MLEHPANARRGAFATPQVHLSVTPIHIAFPVYSLGDRSGCGALLRFARPVLAGTISYDKQLWRLSPRDFCKDPFGGIGTVEYD